MGTKYIRMSWVFDAKEQEQALLALGSACDAFAAEHQRRPSFADRSTLVFFGFEAQQKNMLYDYVALEDETFISFLESHRTEFRPLRVCDARKVLRLPTLPDPDTAFWN
jgi:hypothetical protein